MCFHPKRHQQKSHRNSYPDIAIALNPYRHRWFIKGTTSKEHYYMYKTMCACVRVCSRTRHAYININIETEQQHQIQKQTVVNLIVWFSVFSMFCSLRSFLWLFFIYFYFYLHFYSNWKFGWEFMRICEMRKTLYSCCLSLFMWCISLLFFVFFKLNF